MKNKFYVLNKSLKFTNFVSITTFLLFVLFSTFVCSAELTLQWDQNKESFLSGYKVYYGANPGGQYEGTDADQGVSPVTVPLEELSDINNPGFILTGLDDSKIYYFAVTAYTNEEPYLETGYSNEIYYSESPINFVNNGDSGTSSSGSWSSSGGENPYGDSSLYSKESAAAYTFEASIEGYHEVSLWWTNWSSRCSNIPVEIYDGQTLLDRAYIDQQVDGGQWNSLGSYQFSGTARVVIVSEGDCSTNADAVRFLGDNSVRTYTITTSSGLNGSVSPIDILTVDHGATQTFSITPVEGFHIEDVKIDNESAGALSTYTFENITENHSISATFAINTYTVNAESETNGSISPAGSVAVTHGTNHTFTITPNDGYHVIDVLVDGTSVGPIASYTFDNIDMDHSLYASFEPDEDPREIVIDNSDVSISTTGTWSASGGANPYSDVSLYSRGAGDTFTFEKSISGFYEIALWWTNWPSRCVNTPVEIYDGEILLDTVFIDQLVNGGQWNVLGSYMFNGTARVVLISEGECTVSADAVKFVYQSEPTSEGIIIDNGEDGTSSSGTWINSGGENPYGETSLYSKGVNTTYTFETSGNGYHEVSLWWTNWQSRCNSTPVEIYDGETLVDTVYVDQQTDGGQWNVLGSYMFKGTASVVLVSEGECTVSADAVKFIYQQEQPVQEVMVDNGESGTSSSGTWGSSGGADPYGDSSLYSKEAGATYTFEASVKGNYEVSLWWTYWGSRCTDAPIEIYDGEILLDTVYVDQQADGGQWNALGAYEFTDTARVVVVSEGDCSVNADGVRFVYQSMK